MSNNRHSTQVQTFQQAQDFLARGRYKDQRPLTGRSTVLVRRDEHTIAVRYHATDVVTFHDDGRITLNSGGWRSMTTKERMSTYSPISIAQTKGLWYIWDWRRPVEPAPVYFDGIECDESGALLNAKPIEDGARLEHAKRHIDRLVKRYIAGFEAEARKAGALEKPSGGDCWICAFAAAAAPEGDVSHLLEHLQEGYYVPTLLANAIKERGYGGGVAFIWRMIDRDIEQAHGDLFHLRNSLRQYFRARKLALAEMFMARGEVAA